MNAGSLSLRRSARYRFGAPLGHGAFGEVVRAFDDELGIEVAIKRLARSDPASLFHFKQEFRALADLSHPHLVKLYELFCLDDVWYFSMDLVAGVPFAQYVRGAALDASALPTTQDERHGVRAALDAADAEGAEATPLEGADARLRHVLAQLASGLSALHVASLLHRDLKPSNVLVTPAGRLSILDFGLVAPLGEGMGGTLEPRVVGTPGYMAPEQMDGLVTTAAADWYSVGIMIYEALVGRVPFIGTLDGIRAAQRAGAPDPRVVRPEAPADLARLCVGLLSPRPEDRPGSAEVLALLRVDPGDAQPRGQARSPRFVGRAAELAALHEALDDTARGKPAVVLLSGPSGVGKTALIGRFLHERRVAGAAVLAGRCHERESMRFNAVDGLVDSLTQHLRALPPQVATALMPRDPHALARLFPVFGRLPVVAAHPPRTAPDTPQEQRRRASAALRELLARLADRQPVIVFLDDLQWADADSMTLLGELLVEPDPPALLLVLAFREGQEDARPLGALRQRLRRLVASARELGLGELQREEAMELARDLVGGDTPEGEVAALALAIESGGSPLLLEELARVRRELGGPSPSLDDVIEARLGVLSSTGRRLLDVLAAAGRPLDLAVARRAADITPAETQAAVQELRARNLIGSGATGLGTVLEPLHDRVRVVVVRRQTAAVTRTCHLALATALEALGRTEPETMAMHLRLGGEPARARPFLLQAADGAVEALAFDRAASLYGEAMADSAGGERAHLQQRRGEVLSFAGRGAEAAAAYAEAVTGASSHERVELQRRVADQLLRSGRIDEGLAAVRSVLAMTGMSLPSSPRRALASFLVQRARLRRRGMRYVERAERLVPPALLAEVDVCWTVGNGLSSVDMVRGGDFQTRHLLRALDAGEPYRIARGLAFEAAMAARGGGRGARRAARLLPQAMALAERAGNPYAIGLTHAAGAVLAWTEARWRDGIEVAGQAIAVFQAHSMDSAWEVGAVDLLFRLRPLLALGELDRFIEGVALSLAEAEERQDRFTSTLCGVVVLPWVHMIGDRPDEAFECSGSAIAGWSREGWHLQHHQDMRSRALADVYRGAPERAVARIETHWPQMERAMHLRIQNERIQTFHMRSVAVLAHARAGAGRAGEDRLREVERDARRLLREGNRWADAVGTAIAAGVAASRRQPDAARRYAEAAHAYDGLGMALHAAAARRRRGVLVGGAEGARAVEAADRRMAELGVASPERLTQVLVG